MRLRTPGSKVVVEVVRGDLLIRLFVPLGDRGKSLELEVEGDEGDEGEFGPESDP